MDGFSRPQRTRAEIVKPYHLSYPHTVALGKLWYCMPESARSGGLDLYAWNPERGSWEFQKRMIEGAGILDATLFRHGTMWYLFGALREDGPYDKLRIWWSDSLDGEWQPHSRDPAKVDIRSARSAGPVFQVGECFYRPAQDCTAGYGRAVTINRIDLLTPAEFRETTVSRVQPDPNGPYPDGLHTITVYGDTSPHRWEARWIQCSVIAYEARTSPHQAGWQRQWPEQPRTMTPLAANFTLLELRFFRWIRRSEIAAGVTPGMRAA